MKHKARVNLRATHALLAKDLIDPAMSRLYYALFQAAIHGLERQGKRPGDYTQGETRWRHGWIRDGAGLLRGRREDRLMFKQANSLRERADYREQPVERWEVDELLPRAEAFVLELCP